MTFTFRVRDCSLAAPTGRDVVIGVIISLLSLLPSGKVGGKHGSEGPSSRGPCCKIQMVNDLTSNWSVRDSKETRGGRKPPSASRAEGEGIYLKLITPNMPLALFLGPAVKKSWLVLPFEDVPPPNSMPHS
jgi:hypothetical protein